MSLRAVAVRAACWTLLAHAWAAGAAYAQDVPFPEDLRIEIVSGDGQTGDADGPPPQPLVVRVYAIDYDQPPRADVTVTFKLLRGTARLVPPETSRTNRDEYRDRPDGEGHAAVGLAFGELPVDGPATDDVVVRATLEQAPTQFVEFRLTNRRAAGTVRRFAEPWLGIPLDLPIARVPQGVPCLLVVPAEGATTIQLDAFGARAVFPHVPSRPDREGRCRFVVVPNAPGRLRLQLTYRLDKGWPRKRQVEWIVEAPREEGGGLAGPRVEVVAGDLQYGAPGQDLAQPFELLVRGADGRPAAGVRILLHSLFSGGTLTPPEPSSDADGRVRVRYTCSDRNEVDIVLAEAVSPAGATTAPRATPLVVGPRVLQFVHAAERAPGGFASLREFFTLDWALSAECGGDRPGRSALEEAELLLELRTRDFGPSVTVEVSAQGRDGRPEPEAAGAILPTRLHVRLEAVDRFDSHTLYRSRGLYAVASPYGPTGLTPTERVELAATGRFGGRTVFRIGSGGAALHGPLEADQ